MRPDVQQGFVRDGPIPDDISPGISLICSVHASVAPTYRQHGGSPTGFVDRWDRDVQPRRGPDRPSSFALRWWMNGRFGRRIDRQRYADLWSDRQLKKRALIILICSLPLISIDLTGGSFLICLQTMRIETSSSIGISDRRNDDRASIPSRRVNPTGSTIESREGWWT